MHAFFFFLDPLVGFVQIIDARVLRYVLVRLDSIKLGGVFEMAEFLPIGDVEMAALSTQIDDDEIENLLSDAPEDKGGEEPEKKPSKTHQIMRFKVPIEDADDVTDHFEKIMQEQGFTEADSLTNAGDALVWLIKEGQDA